MHCPNCGKEKLVAQEDRIGMGVLPSSDTYSCAKCGQTWKIIKLVKIIREEYVPYRQECEIVPC